MANLGIKKSHLTYFAWADLEKVFNVPRILNPAVSMFLNFIVTIYAYLRNTLNIISNNVP